MPLFKLGSADIIKGVIVAVLTAIVSALIPILSTGTFPSLSELSAIGITALAAGLAYLLKNLLTNSNDQFLKPE